MGKSPAPALSRGLELLELIAREEQISFSRLEGKSSLNTSSLNRFLKVLLDKAYLAKTDEGLYAPGLKLFSLMGTNNTWKKLQATAHSYLDDISTHFHVTTILFGCMNHQVVSLDKVTHADNVGMQRVGTISRDLFISPWGYLYFASMSKAEQLALEPTFGQQPNPAGVAQRPSPEESRRYIKFIQDRGYSDDNGEIIKNVRRFGVPILDLQGHCHAVLGAGSFTPMLDIVAAQSLVTRMRSAAKRIAHIAFGRAMEFDD
jgi:DNA-binding IclR family transcriptional regulator